MKSTPGIQRSEVTERTAEMSTSNTLEDSKDLRRRRDAARFGVTVEQLREAEESLAEYRRNPESGVSLVDFATRLLKSGSPNRF